MQLTLFMVRFNRFLGKIQPNPQKMLRRWLGTSGFTVSMVNLGKE
jgi:hypothetical protein